VRGGRLHHAREVGGVDAEVLPAGVVEVDQPDGEAVGVGVDGEAGHVFDERQVVGDYGRGHVVLVASHRLDRQDHAKRGDELRGPGAGADHDGVGLEQAGLSELDAAHPATLGDKLVHPVMHDPDSRGPGARLDGGEQHRRVQPPVPR
jgi:hypothetical protein